MSLLASNANTHQGFTNKNVLQEVTFAFQGVRGKADSDKKGRRGCLMLLV